MIVERKQFGAVTLLFVQVGLALYVIVLFLAPQPNGTVKPVVLNVQKVGVAKTTSQATIDALSSNIHAQLLGSGYNPATELSSGSAVSTITASDRTSIEDNVAAGVSNAILGHKVLAIGLDGTQVSSSNSAIVAPELNTLALLLSSQTSWNETEVQKETLSIHTLGISPRAPSVIA